MDTFPFSKNNKHKKQCTFQLPNDLTSICRCYTPEDNKGMQVTFIYLSSFNLTRFFRELWQRGSGPGVPGFQPSSRPPATAHWSKREALLLSTTKMAALPSPVRRERWEFCPLCGYIYIIYMYIAKTLVGSAFKQRGKHPDIRLFTNGVMHRHSLFDMLFDFLVWIEWICNNCSCCCGLAAWKRCWTGQHVPTPWIVFCHWSGAGVQRQALHHGKGHHWRLRPD